MSDKTLNIETVTEKEIASIQGISVKKAREIVAIRDANVTKRVFQGNEIQFSEEYEPSRMRRVHLGKHDQYGHSDTDLSLGKEDSKPTSHFTLRESAIEATLEKIINNQRSVDKKFETFSDEVKRDNREVHTSLQTMRREVKLDVDESLKNFRENIQLEIQEVKKEMQHMREITEKTSEEFNSLKLEMKTDFEIFKDDINKDVKTFKMILVSIMMVWRKL